MARLHLPSTRCCSFLGLGILGVSVLAMNHETRATAQQGQRKLTTEASEVLDKLVTQANRAGYKQADNSMSIAGGWLTQGERNWVTICTITLEAEKAYRFLAAGDTDTLDLDLQIRDSDGKVLIADEGTEADAVVNYSPTTTGAHEIRLRLYASKGNLPCVCLAVVLTK